MTEAFNGGRAARFAEVREAMGLTQQGMADRLNAIAAQLQLPVRYTALSISQRETLRLRLDEEDYAVVSSLPEGKGRWTWAWLAFGHELELKPALETPKLGLAKAADEKPGKGRRRA